jgi:hypothetical protein
MLILALMAMVSAAAPAQPVFFDDFDGDELLPHWRLPPDDHWEYEVSGGMLHVTDLLWPSDQHFGNGNYALMGAGYAPQTDFRADVWMGWEAGDDPHELIFHVIGPQGQGIASFGYSTLIDYPDPIIFAASGANDHQIDSAPAPGLYHFTITRRSGEFNFFFDGESFAAFPDRFGTPAASLILWFLGPYPGELGPLHIDRVRVVPAPGALALPAAVGLYCQKRKRGRF